MLRLARLWIVLKEVFVGKAVRQSFRWEEQIVDPRTTKVLFISIGTNSRSK